jgi:hypothetical protein
MSAARFYTVVLSFLSPIILLAQPEGADPATNAIDLDVNNVRARIMNGNDMFWDLVSSPRYEVPKVTITGQVRRHTMLCASMWIGGIDDQGDLHAAAMTYRQNGGWDYFPGPIGDGSNMLSKSWDRLWVVTRKEIDDFKKDTSKLTEAIKKWPAHPMYAGMNEPKYIAPFVDTDNDGIYNPAKGDYPDIRGDQAIFYVCNDIGNEHTETGALPLGVELKVMAYAYADKQKSYLDNSTFFHYTITNRSENDYHDVYISMFTDIDIGYGFDDYIGCDTSLNAVYGYNGDDKDEGFFGYGDYPPAQALVFLNAPMQHFLAYNNSYDVTNGNPYLPQHYYNYQKGRWQDGTAITIGDNGLLGTVPTHFMYPGDPHDTSAWSEESAGNRKGDRRSVEGFGPFDLVKGQTLCVDVAFVFAQDSANGRLGSVTKLKSEINKVREFYEGLNYNCSYTPAEVKLLDKQKLALKLFPNPASQSLYLAFEEYLAGNANLEITDMSGRVLKRIEVPAGQDNTIDIRDLPKGMYILRVQAQNKTTSVKFVKR